MKRFALIFALCLAFISGCGKEQAETKNTGKAQITDAFGQTSYIDKSSRVVSCYGSFADCLLLSGGSLCGVTSDAVEEHGLDVGDAQIIGSVKHIDLEALAKTKPDYVMLSADLAAHLSLKDALDALGIAYGYFRVDSFGDYKALMEQLCAVNERADLYSKNVFDVEQKIQQAVNSNKADGKSCLLLRVYSTGMKAKSDDNFTGHILSDMGLCNIVGDSGASLEDISLEYIAKLDPDYIFAIPMGNELGAFEYLDKNLKSNPLWSSLKAVKNGNCHLLPKELFHYKPNNRWSESYEYIARLICAEASEQ